MADNLMLQFEENLTSNEYRKELLDQLNEHRRANYLCDVILVADGQEFPAHRAVLSGCKGFFHGLFASEMKERKQFKIHLHHVHPNVLDAVLSYIYTGEIEPNRDNAELVLVAADFLLLDKLKSAMDSYLTDAIKGTTSSFSLSMYDFSKQYKCEKLQEATMKSIRENFESVLAEGHEFLKISVETLEEILDSDDLQVSSEEMVYKAILDWLNQDRKERELLFPRLFYLIRVESISEEFIRSTIINESLVTRNPLCLYQVLKSAKYLPTDASKQHPRDCLDKYTNVILVFPQYSAKEAVFSGPWCYVPSENKWCRIPVPRDAFKYGYGYPVYFAGSVYVLRKEGKHLGVVLHRYELELNCWFKVGRIKEVTADFFSLGCLAGVIYFVGGKVKTENVVKSLNEVYTCDLKARPKQIVASVTKVSPMSENRSSCNVIASDNHIYAIGGNSITTRHGQMFSNALKSMERYDPNTDTWEKLSPMRYKTSSSSQSCTILDEKIFVIGEAMFCNTCTTGSAGPATTHTEMYDIPSDTWSMIASSPLLASNSVLVSCSHSIYLIAAGTFNSERKHKNREPEPADQIRVSVYDMKKNCWSPEISRVGFHPNIDLMVDSLALGGVAVRLHKEEVALLPPLGDAET